MLLSATILEPIRRRLRWIEYSACALPTAIHFVDCYFVDLLISSVSTIEVSIHFARDADIAPLVLTGSSPTLP